MKEALQAMLERSLPQPGVAAWAARRSDRTVASHCYSDWFGPAQVEQALNRLTLAAESLKPHRIDPLRMGWVFEHARILFALRPDGACLALFLENRPGLSSAGLESVLQEFAGLPAA